MVLTPAEVPITRADVELWIKQWKRKSKAKRPTIEDFIRAKVADATDDPMVNKAHLSEDPAVYHAADLIISDLASYGVATSS